MLQSADIQQGLKCETKVAINGLMLESCTSVQLTDSMYPTDFVDPSNAVRIQHAQGNLPVAEHGFELEERSREEVSNLARYLQVHDLTVCVDKCQLLQWDFKSLRCCIREALHTI